MWRDITRLTSFCPALSHGQLDEYLHDAEYATVFGMSRDAYLGLPAWKRLNLKVGGCGRACACGGAGMRVRCE